MKLARVVADVVQLDVPAASADELVVPREERTASADARFLGRGDERERLGHDRPVRAEFVGGPRHQREEVRDPGGLLIARSGPYTSSLTPFGTMIDRSGMSFTASLGG